jgi:hypothetical protein
MAYAKSPQLAHRVHSGFLDDYQDRRFIPGDNRQPVGNPDNPQVFGVRVLEWVRHVCPPLDCWPQRVVHGAEARDNRLKMPWMQMARDEREHLQCAQQWNQQSGG